MPKKISHIHLKVDKKKMRFDPNSPGAPLDTTEDAQEELGDTYGLTGITTNQKRKISEDASVDDIQLKPNQRSNNANRKAEERASGRQEKQVEKKTGRSKKNISPIDLDDPAAPPSVKGEEKVSGDMPDPESDDDISENEKEVGLHTTEKEGHPEEVDVAGEVEKAEEYQREH